MLALAFSALFTLYLLIPEGIFRLIFGFFIPTRTFVLTRAETAYRAVLITSIPFFLALALCWHAPLARTWPFPIRENSVQQRRVDYRIVTASLYSEQVFQKWDGTFWHAFSRCSRRQARLVVWYFLLIVAEAFLLGKLSSSYLKVKNKSLRWVADKLLSAYISQWYGLLTPNLLPHSVTVQADILCIGEMLYRGDVSQYFLKNGELSGIILAKPERFDRVGYLRTKEQGQKPNPNDFWKVIPSQLLYIFVEKVLNINLRYVDVSGKTPDASAVEKLLEDIKPEGFGKITVSVQDDIQHAANKTDDGKVDASPSASEK